MPTSMQPDLSRSRWSAVLQLMCAVIMFGWSYLVLADTPIRALLHGIGELAPEEWQGYAKLGLMLIAWMVVPLVALIVLYTAGASLWMEMHRRRNALAVYQRGTSEALADARSMMQRQLAEAAKDPKLSPAELAELRAIYADVERKTTEDMRRQEEKYRAQPELLERDRRKTIEEIRARHKKNGKA
jgi:hypothetical protein